MEILVAILLLSILILVHEFGHFMVALRAGILVEEFGIGLPPRIFGIKINQTIYSLNFLPFGGFVKLHGESKIEQDSRKEVAFFAKPLHVRFAVLLSGVAMNFFLGVLLFSILFTIGTPVAITENNQEKNLDDKHIELIAIASNSPAQSAGLKIGDRILGISTKEQNLAEDNLNPEEIRKFIKNNAGKEVAILVQRGKQRLTISAIPRTSPPPGEGPLGIAMAEVGTLRYPWYRSIFEAFRASFLIAGNTFAALYFVFRDIFVEGKISPSIAGPVGIIRLAGEAAQLGILRLINFAAILTINLAVLNILPIPALDGGRIMFLGIEKLRKKPISQKVEQALHAAGMAILIALILLITIYDIKRL